MKATILTNRKGMERTLRKISSNAKKTALSLLHYMKQSGFDGGYVKIRHWEHPVSAYLLKECILLQYKGSRVDIEVDESLTDNPLLTDLVISY